MTTIRRRSRLAASIAAMLLVAAGATACGDDDSTTTTTEAAGGSSEELTISDVWARPATDLAATDRSAIYMVIEGGSEDDALVAAMVPTDIAAVTEVHETTMAEQGDGDMDGSADMDSEGDIDGGADMESEGDMNGGMMQMREVDRIDIPAGGTVLLEPGGFHVMLLELQTPLVPGDTVDVTLTFELAGERTVTAEVREP
jgi:periplasmic copper chaperone A